MKPKKNTKTRLSVSDYQNRAWKTNMIPSPQTSIENCLKNMIEAAEVMQKWLLNKRFQENTLFREKAPTKIGDVLWYAAAIAKNLNQDLEDICTENLDKCESRWGTGRKRFYDEGFSELQQIPREFTVKFDEKGKTVTTLLKVKNDLKWFQLGAYVDDNAHEDDGYRYHDIFHIAHATVLGWSPVLRRLLHRKRKDAPEVDRVEDGARAGHLEEAITAYIFEQAKVYKYFKEETQIDFRILKTVERLTLPLEVRSKSPELWKEAILKGYRVFNLLKENKGGIVKVSLLDKKLHYQKSDRAK